MKIPFLAAALCIACLTASCTSKNEEEKPKTDEKSKALQEDE